MLQQLSMHSPKLRWKTTFQLALAVSLLLTGAREARADITFTFTESGGTVTMQTSGTLNTANLVSGALGGWGGVGVENNNSPESDIMGDTTMGGVNVAFGFSATTDVSPWIGSMFTSSNFGWSTVGTTQFTTYHFPSGVRTPGIGIATEDMVGALWTPDVSWSQVGTLAGFGLTPGTYAITDAVTGESITIQIGVAVPEPTSLALGAGAVITGLGVTYWRRKQKKSRCQRSAA